MIGKLDGGYIASGSVSRDAEMKTTTTGKFVTEFSLLAGKKPDGTTRFVNCKAWNDLAQAAASLRKHDSVMVAGRLESREYNGETYNDIECDWIGQSLGGGDNRSTSNSAPKHEPPATSAPTAQPAEPTFTELADESELPF